MKVFADNEIHTSPTQINPIFQKTMENADIFVGSLIFDYDDASAVESLLHHVKGPKLLFECSSELMAHNEIGSFSMERKDGDVAGPPEPIKALLSKCISGKEEVLVFTVAIALDTFATDPWLSILVSTVLLSSFLYAFIIAGVYPSDSQLVFLSVYALRHKLLKNV
jgi:hypothetical protein